MCGLITNSAATHSRVVLALVFITLFHFLISVSTAATRQELARGFRASPDTAVRSFQPLLNDPTGNFSLGFLRVEETQLAVVILHVASSETIWTVNLTTFPAWTDRALLRFDGGFVLSDADGRVVWSTDTAGDRAVLLNSSNLQIQLARDPPVVLWQSFDFPADTLVENQNFSSEMALISSNRAYSARLGADFIGLYAEFNEGRSQIYYRHRALQAKAQVIPGGGPIHLQLHSDGYLGMYQNGTVPVDLQAFNTFQKPANGFLRLRLDTDGNLRGFYWEGSKWDLVYEAISEQCELPSPCGSYGLCEPGAGCSCLDNRTVYSSGQCIPADSGDFCGNGVAKKDFWVLRRSGVELPFKELMNYRTGFTKDQCESFCETNCSCWGSLYYNATGFCYLVDYPVRTVVAVADGTKTGYFKVRQAPSRTKLKMGLEIGLGILAGIVGIAVMILGFASYRQWRRRRGIGRFFEDDDGSVSPGPYKDLGSASFKSIEMGSGFVR
ncbi:PAN domain-containing protein At5g03700 [Cucurbita moschata]|uniref:PAN domain-containing protein At5g03700 n=1 Tax=Cucurbita moschata TaxID=3662 RepID=A0A6J1F151_CUCMO|nr:PAN domain-containing protein At5g03700 [Cucurbita moschata]